MTVLVTPAEMDPMASASLRGRFHQLVVALDSESVRDRLQSALFEGTGLYVESCARPKAEIAGDICWLQYPLQVRTTANLSRDVLVIGALFAEPARAAEWERRALFPLAAWWSPPLRPVPRPTATLAELGMAVSVFPVNGSLPSIVDATNPQTMTRMFSSLIGDGNGPQVTSVELVLFRRSRGCVLRYSLASRDQPTVYGKVGYGAAGSVVHDGLEALAQHPLSHPGRSVFFPRVIGSSTELDLTLVTEIPGESPDLGKEARADQAVDAAALVAAHLHSSGVTIGAAHTLEDELDRATNAVTLIGRDAPALTARLTAVLASVRARAARIRVQPFVLAHGSFAPSQLMLDGPNVGVLDFDRLCQAEPAFDLGRFLAPLRVKLAKHGLAAGDGLAARLLETYHALGGLPTPHERVALYEVASLARMAARSWLQLKPSRLHLVCSILEQHLTELDLAT